MDERRIHSTSTSDEPDCILCRSAMKLVRRIPRLGVLPAEDIYHCTECGLVKSYERRLH